MTQFDATTQAQISRSIAEQVERAKVGRVVEVFEHVQEDDKSNFEVDVELISSIDKQHRAIPYETPHSEEIKIPKVGDHVMVEYHGDSDRAPIARGAVHTSGNRPPLGRAGMWRKKIPSDTSPAGDGDLYVESYTAYSPDPASPEFSKESSSVLSSFIRLGKKVNDNDNPIDGDTLPMMIELFDNPNGDESEIRIEGNAVDGDTSKGMDINFDLKNGILKVEGVNGSDSYTLELDVVNETATLSGDGTNEMGVKFDFTDDTFTIIDGNGYGIESDGSGNFTWHYETLNYSKGTTTTL